MIYPINFFCPQTKGFFFSFVIIISNFIRIDTNFINLLQKSNVWNPAKNDENALYAWISSDRETKAFFQKVQKSVFKCVVYNKGNFERNFGILCPQKFLEEFTHQDYKMHFNECFWSFRFLTCIFPLHHLKKRY